MLSLIPFYRMQEYRVEHQNETCCDFQCCSVLEMFILQKRKIAREYNEED